jgi:type IV pilus assembly protein PilC
VLLTLIGVLIFLLTWVIPTFEDLFAETGVALPWLTRQLLNTSEIVSSYWLLAFNSLILALIAAILCYRHIDTARQRIAEMTARLPIYGALLRKRLATQSATLLSALIRSGIPILEALTIIAESAPTTKLANEMTRVRHDILQGNQLSSSLERSTILPPIVAQMAAIGETSGRLDLMLGKAGALIKQELDATIEKLKQLTEPCLVLTVGVVVGIIAIAIYAPIFQLGELTAAR